MLIINRLCCAVHRRRLARTRVHKDVVQIFADPPVPLYYQRAEDRRVGIVLLGYNVTYVSANKFHPWGHCYPDAILIHYMRNPSQLKRYYARAVSWFYLSSTCHMYMCLI